MNPSDQREATRQIAERRLTLLFVTSEILGRRLSDDAARQIVRDTARVADFEAALALVRSGDVVSPNLEAAIFAAVARLRRTASEAALAQQRAAESRMIAEKIAEEGGTPGRNAVSRLMEKWGLKPR